MKELYLKQKEYIEFLENQITKTSPLLYIHGWSCSEDVIKEGNKLREEIKTLTDQFRNNE